MDTSAAILDGNCYDCIDIENSWSQRMEEVCDGFFIPVSPAKPWITFPTDPYQNVKYGWRTAQLNDKIPTGSLVLRGPRNCTLFIGLHV